MLSLSLKERISQECNFSKVLEFLEEYEFGKENQWCQKLMKFINEFLTPLESQQLGLYINMIPCAILSFPRVSYLCVVAHIFMLKALVDAKINDVHSMKEKGPDFIKLCKRTLITIYEASLAICQVNKLSLLGNSDWKSVELSRQYQLFYQGMSSDSGVWKEYMSFLENETYVLSGPPDNSVCCQM